MPGGKPVDLERLFLKQANLYSLHKFIDSYVTGGPVGPQFIFAETLVRKLHSVVMAGLLSAPGEYRKVNVGITNSHHQPPPWAEVPTHMATLVQYVNENWKERDLVHLAAFVMWRLCWIHPFENGNGRTARGASYLVLCAKHGKLLPPKNSVIEQIMREKLAMGAKAPYYLALGAVDQVYQQTGELRVCCHPLEQLLSAQLKEQIRANLT